MQSHNNVQIDEATAGMHAVLALQGEQTPSKIVSPMKRMRIEIPMTPSTDAAMSSPRSMSDSDATPRALMPAPFTPSAALTVAQQTPTSVVVRAKVTTAMYRQESRSVCHLSNLPWVATEGDIARWLSTAAAGRSALTVSETHAKRVRDPTGRPTGECFVAILDSELVMAMSQLGSGAFRMTLEDTTMSALSQLQNNVDKRAEDMPPVCIRAETPGEFDALMQQESEESGRARAIMMQKGEKLGSDSEKDSAEPEYIVKIRGLPFTSNANEIAGLFTAFGVTAERIVMGVHRHGPRRGANNGECYVRFQSEERGMAALKNMQGCMLGRRYLELFPSCEREMLNSTAFGGEEVDRFGITTPSSGKGAGKGFGKGSEDPKHANTLSGYKFVCDTVERMRCIEKATAGQGSWVKVRGLPYAAGPKDIADFLNFVAAPAPLSAESRTQVSDTLRIAESALAASGLLAEGQLFFAENDMSNMERIDTRVYASDVLIRYGLKDARATGDAVVFVPHAAHVVQQKVALAHRKRLGARYVEVFYSSLRETEGLMTQGAKLGDLVDTLKRGLLGIAVQKKAEENAKKEEKVTEEDFLGSPVFTASGAEYPMEEFCLSSGSSTATDADSDSEEDDAMTGPKKRLVKDADGNFSLEVVEPAKSETTLEDWRGFLGQWNDWAAGAWADYYAKHGLAADGVTIVDAELAASKDMSKMARREAMTQEQAAAQKEYLEDFREYMGLDRSMKKMRH